MSQNVPSIFVSAPRYLSAGLLAGIFIGSIEAIALNLSDPSLNDRAILWWAPVFYALLFAPLGLLVGLSIHTALSLLGKSDPARSYALTYAITLLLGALSALRWRLHLDHAWLAKDYGRLVDVGILGAALLLAGMAYLIIRKSTLPIQSAAAAILILAGAAAAQIPLQSTRSLDPVDTAAPNAPNIILIAIDTLRADYLTLYDNEADTSTPAIDAFAADSILFKEGVAQSPWTKPSFGSIYTSQHPREHTAIDRTRPLPDEAVTLAEALRAAGYHTLGMSNSNPNNSSAMNFDQGYAHFEDIRPDGYMFGIPVSGQRLTLYTRAVSKVIERIVPYRVNVEQYFLRADRITGKGLAWVDSETSRERPFFMTLHYMDPHDPYMDGRRKGEGYSYYRFKTRSHGPDFVEKIKNAYAGDIDFMDTHLGTLFDGLRERGLYDDALILLTSDHGEEFFEHGDFYHGRTLYEESIGVPLIVKLPDNQAAGQVNEFLARHIDIAPTILSLSNSPVPESMKGQPLVDARGESLNANIEHAISETNLLGPDLASIRTTTDKFIRDASYGDEVTRRELYNLNDDPEELDNVAEKFPEKTRTLAALLDAFLSRTQGRGSDEAVELAPGVEEQLRTLGYID